MLFNNYCETDVRDVWYEVLFTRWRTKNLLWIRFLFLLCLCYAVNGRWHLGFPFQCAGVLKSSLCPHNGSLCVCPEGHCDESAARSSSSPTRHSPWLHLNCNYIWDLSAPLQSTPINLPPPTDIFHSNSIKQSLPTGSETLVLNQFTGILLGVLISKLHP